MFQRWIFGAVMVLLLATVGCSNTSTSVSTTNTIEPTVLPSTSDSEGQELRGAVLTPPRELSDFSLMSTQGGPFTLSEHRGDVILLYFGYRTCPDFCPTTFSEMRLVYEGLNEPDNLKVVFVTVDPERDTIENLTQYISNFNTDFIALRDEGAGLQGLMDEFGITATRRQINDSPLGYLIDHTASLYLIGPDGKLQVQYLYGTPYQDVMHDVEVILQSV